MKCNYSKTRLRDFAFKISKQRQRAFTLIELLLVLVILGILAAIVVPKFSGRTEQARMTAAQSQIATFGTALDAFEVDNGYYPKGKSGLNDLVQQPRGLPVRDELLDYDISWHLEGRRFGGFVGAGPPVWRFDRRFRTHSASPN